ncbi:Retrovirus-related Pol polyprotein from transposon RE1, partial [Bienertia sinuspersici]
MLPLPSNSGEGESGDEMEINCVEATHHITGCLEYLKNAIKVEHHSKIHLPNGENAAITHVGEVKLRNGPKLSNVIYAPHFKHNLMSINKLIHQEGCRVVFNEGHCLIEEQATSCVLGVGRVVKGVYHLVNVEIKELVNKLKQTVKQKQVLKKESSNLMTAN